MKVAMVNLTGGGLSGGYVKYLRELAPRLRADPRIGALTIVLPPGAAESEFEALDPVTWPVGDARRGHRWLRAFLMDAAPDAVLIPTARWLDCRPIPTVIMVRNMEPLAVPFSGNTLSEGVKNLLRAYRARVACRRATRVLAVSRHVRDFLVARWRVDPDRIGLVYHGIDPVRPDGPLACPPALVGTASGTFVFTAGSIRPARGLEDALRAMASLARTGLPVRLVIAGRPDRGTVAYDERLRRLVTELGLVDRVVWAGQLSSAEMAWCFSHAAAFVVTSRAEACPNTVLEAMSHGCQLVSTRLAPMPEFLGAAAIYYEPGDADELAAGVTRVLEATPEDRRTRAEAARSRAGNFTWAQTACRTIAQLELVAGRGETAWTT